MLNITGPKAQGGGIWFHRYLLLKNYEAESVSVPNNLQKESTVQNQKTAINRMPSNGKFEIYVPVNSTGWLTVRQKKDTLIYLNMILIFFENNKQFQATQPFNYY